MLDIQEFVQTRIVSVEAMSIIGVRGKGPEEEEIVFKELNQIISKNMRLNEYEYLVVDQEGIVVGVNAINDKDTPDGLIKYVIPQGEYVVFSFSQEHIGAFWETVCRPENLEKYKVTLARPRFEIFKPELQSVGIVEWYFPLK